MKVKARLKWFYEKLKEFFKDENGGNLIEYALLIGFALFIFFIVISVIMSMINWTQGQSSDFFNIIEDLGSF